jgi:hypothetical protein
MIEDIKLLPTKPSCFHFPSRGPKDFASHSSACISPRYTSYEFLYILARIPHEDKLQIDASLLLRHSFMWNAGPKLHSWPLHGQKLSTSNGSWRSTVSKQFVSTTSSPRFDIPATLGMISFWPWESWIYLEPCRMLNLYSNAHEARKRPATPQHQDDEKIRRHAESWWFCLKNPLIHACGVLIVAASRPLLRFHIYSLEQAYCTVQHVGTQ